MFKCGLECLDDKNSVRQAEKCIDECGVPMHKAMNIVQAEVNSFQVSIYSSDTLLSYNSLGDLTEVNTNHGLSLQGRIDRCLMDCQDGVRNERDEAKAKKLFEDCAESCEEIRASSTWGDQKCYRRSR